MTEEEAIRKLSYGADFSAEVFDEFRSNKKVVAYAWQRDPKAILFSSDEVKQDVAFFREAVMYALEVMPYVPDELKADKDFILEAVKHHHNALRFASDELRNDEAFVYQVVKVEEYAYRGASEEIKSKFKKVDDFIEYFESKFDK